MERLPEKPKNGYLDALIASGVWASLRPASKGILPVIFHYANSDTGRCHLSQGRLAALAGVAIRSVPNAVEELRGHGVLEVQRGGRATGYRLLPLAPQRVAEGKTLVTARLGAARERERVRKAQQRHPDEAVSLQPLQGQEGAVSPQRVQGQDGCPCNGCRSVPAKQRSLSLQPLPPNPLGTHEKTQDSEGVPQGLPGAEEEAGDGGRPVAGLPEWAQPGCAVQTGSLRGQAVRRNGTVVFHSFGRPAWHPEIATLLEAGRLLPADAEA